MSIGRHKTTEFRRLKERVWVKLKSWKGKILTLAGKAILIFDTISCLGHSFVLNELFQAS